jgi:hypothetical protein
MADPEHSTEEILLAIGREMRQQTEHLRKIRTSVGILAFLSVMGLVASLVLAATA